MHFFSALMRHEIFRSFVNIIAFLLYMKSCSHDVNGTLMTEHGTKGRFYVIALSGSINLVCHFLDPRCLPINNITHILCLHVENCST